MVAVMNVQQIVQLVLQQQVALHAVLDITYMKKIVSTNVQMVQSQQMVNVHLVSQAVVDVVPQLHASNVKRINSLSMMNALMNVQMVPTHWLQLKVINVFHVIRIARHVMDQIVVKNVH